MRRSLRVRVVAWYGYTGTVCAFCLLLAMCGNDVMWRGCTWVLFGAIWGNGAPGLLFDATHWLLLVHFRSCCTLTHVSAGQPCDLVRTHVRRVNAYNSQTYKKKLVRTHARRDFLLLRRIRSLMEWQHFCAQT